MDEFAEQQEAFKRIYEGKEVADLLIKKIHDDIIPMPRQDRKSYVSPTRSLTK